MEPNLEQRLRSADPLHGQTGNENRDQEWLVTAAAAAAAKQDRSRVTTPRIAAAAAALMVAATAGGLIASDRAGGSNTGVRPAATVTELAMAPETPSMSSCIPFSVESLGSMPMAFSGEVTQRTDAYVLIDVDTWYRGGDTDQVNLRAPEVSLASLGDFVDFKEGSRYLVTAGDGTVNYCGFTSLWSQDMADAFSTAFGNGR